MCGVMVAMYEGAQILVGMAEGNSKAYSVKMALHHGSVLKFSAISDSRGSLYSRTVERFADDLRSVCVRRQ